MNYFRLIITSIVCILCVSVLILSKNCACPVVPGSMNDNIAGLCSQIFVSQLIIGIKGQAGTVLMMICGMLAILLASFRQYYYSMLLLIIVITIIIAPVNCPV